MTTAKYHDYRQDCTCGDCAFMRHWKADRLEELLSVPIEERRSWYRPEVVAIVDETLATGGIKSDADYDRFYDKVMALPPKEYIDENGDVITFGPGIFSHELRNTEMLYAAMTETDEMDLPSPKCQREKLLEAQVGDIKVYGRRAEYEDEYIYGLFRRGAAHILHGPSGTGKTTLLLEFEDAGRNGREFLDYKGDAVDPLFIVRDRPISDYHETLDGLGLPRDFVRMVELPFSD